jgi:hypothetical protein
VSRHFTNSIPLLFAGVRSGIAFVAALIAAGLAAQFSAAPPIFLALVATLVVASAGYLLAAQGPFDADYTNLNWSVAQLIGFLVAVIGLSGAVTLVPAVNIFVCEPLVPWQFSIAIFGAFGMNWLASATALRVPQDRARLMIHLAFFWIAPFYGFFHAPWFLAQTVAIPCGGRPTPQAIIVVIGMIIAAGAGRRMAIWMLR